MKTKQDKEPTPQTAHPSIRLIFLFYPPAKISMGVGVIVKKRRPTVICHFHHADISVLKIKTLDQIKKVPQRIT